MQQRGSVVVSGSKAQLGLRMSIVSNKLKERNVHETISFASRSVLSDNDDQNRTAVLSRLNMPKVQPKNVFEDGASSINHHNDTPDHLGPMAGDLGGLTGIDFTLLDYTNQDITDIQREMQMEDATLDLNGSELEQEIMNIMRDYGV